MISASGWRRCAIGTQTPTLFVTGPASTHSRPTRSAENHGMAAGHFDKKKARVRRCAEGGCLTTPSSSRKSG